MLGEVTGTITALKNEFLELREYATGNWLEAPQAMLVFKNAAVAAGDATGKLRQGLCCTNLLKARVPLPPDGFIPWPQ